MVWCNGLNQRISVCKGGMISDNVQTLNSYKSVAGDDKLFLQTVSIDIVSEAWVFDKDFSIQVQNWLRHISGNKQFNKIKMWF